MPSNVGSSGFQHGGGNGSQAEVGSVRVTTGSITLPAIEKLKIREGSWSAVEPAKDEIFTANLKTRSMMIICLSLETITDETILEHNVGTVNNGSMKLQPEVLSSACVMRLG